MEIYLALHCCTTVQQYKLFRFHNMIELKDIEFSYPKAASPALTGIKALIEPGIHLLCGDNGAGKTTLLHLISGVSRPSSGECLIDGTPSASAKPSEIRRTFMLEESTFFPAWSVRDFAKIHSQFYPTFSSERFESNLSAFGLNGRERMKDMSLGNRKKSHLSYALALGVDVLLLDEPTNALDIQSKETLRRLLASSIADGQTIIVATHNVAELDTLYDGALMLNRSRLIFAGTSEAVTAKLAFRASRVPLSDALYQEIQAGRMLCIIPADDYGSTRIDWRLLYSAMHSPSREKIAQYLRS